MKNKGHPSSQVHEGSPKYSYYYGLSASLLESGPTCVLDTGGIVCSSSFIFHIPSFRLTMGRHVILPHKGHLPTQMKG